MGAPKSDASFKTFVDALGYRFTDPSELQVALTHRSAAHEANSARRGRPLRDNERLEFLGDAVLALVVSEALFRAVPEAVEGDLTRMRAAVVNERSLAQVATALDLGAALRLGKGEAQTGGRTKASLLANALEAVFAAVFLDGGLEAVRGVIERLLAAELDAVTAPVRAAERALLDEKSALQELVQSRHGLTPRYRVVSAEGPDHAREWTVEVLVGDEVRARGRGRSKKIAEQEAARVARGDVEGRAVVAGAVAEPHPES